ncbi:MAG: response regulator [Bacteroidota bacterium]
MKILIVEDDYVSRTILRRLLLPYGETHIAVDGEEGITAFASAQNTGQPFDLVCLDIMLPRKDGQSVLREIRALESARPTDTLKPARIIMTTALSDRSNVVEAIKHCDGYLVKPYKKEKLIECLIGLGLATG